MNKKGREREDHPRFGGLNPVGPLSCTVHASLVWCSPPTSGPFLAATHDLCHLWAAGPRCHLLRGAVAMTRSPIGNGRDPRVDFGLTRSITKPTWGSYKIEHRAMPSISLFLAVPSYHQETKGVVPP